MIFKKLGFLSSLFLLFAFLLPACKDDVVVPPAEKQLDTARYNWRMDGPLSADIKGIWALDTNNIFLMDVANQDLIKYDGNQYLRYHYSSFFSIDFAAWNISGVSNTEVYIGGDDNRINEPSFGKPQIKKWNGASFETINIPDTFSYYSYISDIYTGEPGVLWLGTSKGRVLKYRTGLIEETFIDTSQFIIRFMKDESNNLYFLAYRDSCNSNHTWCRAYVSIFKRESTLWKRVFYREYEPPQIVLIPQNSGEEIYACDNAAFYKFTGTGYEKMFDIYGFRAGLIHWSGSSQSNIMCLGGSSNPCGNIYHWDGKSWSDENVQLYHCELEITNIQSEYICSASDGVAGECYIYYGTPKTKAKHFNK
jgi:hypothetical protein